MRTKGSEAREAWREAERRLEALPKDAPERPECVAAVERARRVYLAIMVPPSTPERREPADRA